jgi:copper chaperone CopZ
VSIATFHVPDISNKSAERTIVNLLVARPGVRDVEASSQAKRVRLVYDEREARLDDLKDALVSAGYEVAAVY